MKYESADYGYVINEGDIIVIDDIIGRSYHEVERVTKNYAFVKFGKSKGKFPRVYSSGFQSLPRHTWNTTKYQVYTPKL